ncbi:MAG: VWA domain-containing protein, partial [Gammaproteobacteria bacterium]|nr:VWA domain-containing protein [Gammaproteobacteria bacterium]
MTFHLMRPEWLWAIVPALLLTLLLWRCRGRNGSWSTVIAPELLPFLVGKQAGSQGPNLLPLVLLGWMLAALAASGPSWQKLPQPIHQKQDALVLVLDLSYSMKSGDLTPSRLDRVRQKMLDLLALRREGQTGLIAYAGDAHIVTPLTDDTPTIANLLPALNPDMMPVPGSDPAAAVAQAVELLHSAGIREGKVLLITDGISNRDHQAIEKALAKSAAGFAIMGVGTATGAPIPLPDGGFLKDQNGTIVMPSLDEAALNKLADATGGRYLPMQIDNSDLDVLLAESALPGREATLALDRTADTWEDQGYLLILLLLPLALGLFRRGWVLCLLPVILMAQPETASAQQWDDLWLTPDQQGQQALQQGDIEAAADLFENSDWAGTAAYQSEDYEAAVEDFSQSETADSWYNRGNALARAGQLDEAIDAYRESLELAPEQADASENLALLEQLKEQQEQQEQQQNQDQQENQDQQQDQDQDQDQQQDQQQNQDPQQNQDQQQNQDRQQNRDQQQDQDPQQNQDQQQSEEEEEEEQQQAQGEQEQQDQETEQKQQAMEAADPEEQERDQAMEQWLRRVPDDPSGLLREKFRYESRQRQEQGNRTD